MCVSMVDIQSTTAEIRRGKTKIEKETTGRKYNVLPYSVATALISLNFVNACMYYVPLRFTYGRVRILFSCSARELVPHFQCHNRGAVVAGGH